MTTTAAPALARTNFHSLTGARLTGVPSYGRTVTGYGGKIPLGHEVQFAGSQRWRRVYVACYGNSGAAYVVINGVDHYLDANTEGVLEAMRQAPTTFEAARAAQLCQGRVGTKDDRCGRVLGHTGPCDWTD